MATRPYLQRAGGSRSGDISEATQHSPGTGHDPRRRGGGEYQGREADDPDRRGRECSESARPRNEGASDEEAVGDTIRALVNHGWRS
jgi:hypothetical protein